MSKQGMKRPEKEKKEKIREVPEIQGKEKHENIIIKNSYVSLENSEKPISDAYTVIDTDVARDNIENDLSAADLQDL